jgi:hypothetical protein
MIRRSTALLAVLLAIGTLWALPALAQDDAEITERGQALTTAFYAGELDEIVEGFDDQMREMIPDVAALEGFRDQILGTFGDESEVLGEEVHDIPGHRIYRRTVRFENTPENPMDVIWGFDEEGRISGFSVQPVQGTGTE